MDKAWTVFIAKAHRMAGHQMNSDAASSFFEDLLIQKNGKPLSKKAQREHEAIIALFGSAPGQDLSSDKENLFAVVPTAQVLAEERYDIVLKAIRDGASMRAGVNLKSVGDAVVVENLVELGCARLKAILVANVDGDAAVLA
jgi:hypothetical protein